MLRAGPRIVVGILLLAVAIWIPTRRADAEDDTEVYERWSRVRVASLEKLHRLASWCSSMKLFSCRADVYQGVLVLSPDDEAARKWLRYEKAADGTWTQDPLYQKPRNLNRGADRYRERRNQLGDWFVEEAGPLLGGARENDMGRLTTEILDTALAVAPGNERIRAWNREIRDPAAKGSRQKAPWILEETERARLRRPALRETARKAREAVPKPKDGARGQRDALGGVEWKHVLQGPRSRIVGLPERDELEALLRNVEATWEVFEEAFGYKPGVPLSSERYGRGLTVYVADSLEAGNQYLAAQPGITSRELAFVAPLVGTTLRGRPAILVKTPMPESRLEAAPRQVLSGMVRNYLWISAHRAWAAEGLALYLTWQITGTRFISSVTDVRSRYGEGERPIPEYERLLADGKADWLALGLQMMKTPDKPDLLLMAGKDLNHLTKVEALYAYCIVAYLIEGLPDTCVAFFRALGSKTGKNLDATCTEVLGMNARTLEKRVQRWLEESTGAQAARR